MQVVGTPADPTIRSGHRREELDGDSRLVGRVRGVMCDLTGRLPSLPEEASWVEFSRSHAPRGCGRGTPDGRPALRGEATAPGIDDVIRWDDAHELPCSLVHTGAAPTAADAYSLLRAIPSGRPPRWTDTADSLDRDPPTCEPRRSVRWVTWGDSWSRSEALGASLTPRGKPSLGVRPMVAVPLVPKTGPPPSSSPRPRPSPSPSTPCLLDRSVILAPSRLVALSPRVPSRVP